MTHALTTLAIMLVVFPVVAVGVHVACTILERLIRQAADHLTGGNRS